MQENISGQSGAIASAPNKITRLLWWLATAEPALLEKTRSDRDRLAITGICVLGTWAFATLAWLYFFESVTGNTPLSVLLGIFMGLLVLGIDRALIKGIRPAKHRKWLALLFRGCLALMIGLFMAQPALVFLFHKEIQVQISLDNEARKAAKRKEQEAAQASEKNYLLSERSRLQSQLDSQYHAVAAARQAFISETDGTGGSRKVGLKDIARVKQEAYQKLDAEYQARQTLSGPAIRRIDSNLAVLDASLQKEQLAFDELLNDGFLTRIEALSHLIAAHPALAFRYYLLVAILLTIELMPVLAKFLLNTPVYEQAIALREASDLADLEAIHQTASAAKVHLIEKSAEMNRQLTERFFEQSYPVREKKTEKYLQAWEEAPSGSFQQVWESVKQDILTSPES
ncbi:MAG TPA: DUF4407 domain-containing protein [Sediminibacterium sp.]|nr:DUF4407 domain-containing protein [Sediminibacterium sp.]